MCYDKKMLIVHGTLILLGEHALRVQQLVQHQILAIDLAHLIGQWHRRLIVIVAKIREFNEEAEEREGQAYPLPA